MNHRGVNSYEERPAGCSMGHRAVDFFFSTGFVGGPPGALAGTARIGQDVDIGLVGVNYRWGGAPAARY